MIHTTTGWDPFNPCTYPIIKGACGAVSSAAKAVAGDILGTIAKSFVSAAGDIMKTTLSLWMKVGTPQLDNHSGPVGMLRDSTAWLTAAIAVGTVFVCMIKLALMRRSEPAMDAARGLVTLLVATAVAVPLVMLLCTGGDIFSQWILDRSTGGNFTIRVDAMVAGLGLVAPAIVLLIVPLLILTSLLQIGLMIVRIAVLVIFTGALIPLTAAASGTHAGRESHRKVWGWTIAFVAFKPAAAIIYASAFGLIGTGTDIVSVISGLMLAVLAVISLPALLRLVAPLVSPAVHAGSGGALAGGAALVATGARMVSTHESTSNGHSSGNGAVGAYNGATGAAGANGGSGRGGMPGANGRAGAAGATGAAGANGSSATAGAAGSTAVMVATEAAKGAKNAAEGSIPDGSKEEGKQ